MRLCFTDWPRYVPISDYDGAIERMVERLRAYGGIISIYQIGSIGTPGISDIDIIAIFEDGVTCTANPLKELSKTDRQLFIHGLFGTSRQYFLDAQRYTFYHNYKLLWGESLPIDHMDMSVDDICSLKTYIALEYLLKLYISLTIEITYGIVRVRGLLLHTKAVLYDLDFLNVRSGDLHDTITAIVSLREKWHQEKPTKLLMADFTQALYGELTNFLKIQTRQNKLFLDANYERKLFQHITIKSSQELGFAHKGFVLPSFLGSIGRRYFNIQNRWNSFIFFVPCANVELPLVITSKARTDNNVARYNCSHLTFFDPLYIPLFRQDTDGSRPNR